MEQTIDKTGEIVPNLMWVRASDGMVGGVCKGLADSFGLPTWALRLAWLFLILWFGTGLLLYIICALSLPREDKIPAAMNGKILGVCAKLSKKLDVEIGVVRFIAICLLLGSAGVALFAYIIGAVVLSEDSKPTSTRSERHSKFYGA
ncbi:MAG: PspC domain-containing protein [Pseudobdellovibrionaceae bacterium]